MDGMGYFVIFILTLVLVGHLVETYVIRLHKLAQNKTNDGGSDE